MITGYELQVRVIGKKQATVTGQGFYQLYELAPFRFLAVAAGVTVAFIWTVFPVPITEGSTVRKNMGNSLFLLTKYLSSVTSTVNQRIRDKEGHQGLVAHPARKLEKLRQKVLGQEIALLNSMNRSLSMMTWEPHFGGDFPKATYQTIIDEIQRYAT